MKLSILMPVYNERTVVERCISQVLAAPLPEDMERELIIVDDRSTDGTWAILERLAAAHPEIRLFRHEVNRGKGAAVRTAIQQATGDFSHHPGRRPGVRSVRIPDPDPPAARWPRRRRVRLALPRRQPDARAAASGTP